ncbi:Sec-independent protein translocase subunit TatA [Corynebacterium callunae]|uniref:Sec-independent protein translocase subunit TatA n=1 Tax=Corynebacterium callunae TaxID=1721 RepID=UPI001FFEE1C0|nr:Sec-independent protein translocase subunit TatA [Corynebacterium callunae]MCK2200117.1 Sec-independent protein translocase subunit TatA [Corynebacterium callunae]
MPNLGPWEIAMIVLLIIVLFGAKKLPDAARSIGRSMRIFKSEVKELNKDEEGQAPQPAPQQQIAPNQIPAPQPIQQQPVQQPNFEQHYQGQQVQQPVQPVQPQTPQQPDYRSNYEDPNRTI